MQSPAWRLVRARFASKRGRSGPAVLTLLLLSLLLATLLLPSAAKADSIYPRTLGDWHKDPPHRL